MAALNAHVSQSLDRVSLVLHSENKDKDGGEYNDTKTPTQIEGGALRPVFRNVFAKENIGLLVSYACVGIVENAFGSANYPYLNNYLHMDGYQVAAALALTTLPWSYKCFIGMISDSFPIMGYRRKPYMYFGWILSLILLVYMALDPQQQPYFQSPSKDPSTDSENRTVLNADAPGSGGKYVILMMFATLGYLIADVACDAMMVEFAQSEPEDIRGRTQSMAYASRFFVGGVVALIFAICYNGEDYGGTFDWSISFNSGMWITAAGPIIGLVAVTFFITDEKVQGESFLSRLREMGRLAQKRAIWQLMAFNFFNAFLFDATAAPASSIKRDWAKVTPLVDGITNNSLSTILTAVAIWITKTYFLQSSWRKTILITTCVAVIIQWIVDYMLIYDVFRNQYFYVGAPLCTTLPAGIRFIVTTYATVEIAEEGYEGVTYGLITTLNNLAAPLATSVFNQIDTGFDVGQKYIKQDNIYVRNQVAYVMAIMYICKLLSNFTLFLLPNQKREAQQLRLHGGSNFTAALAMFTVALFALVWGNLTNLLSIFKSTSCLKIAGGAGC